jgi:hypothetical protein
MLENNVTLRPWTLPYFVSTIRDLPVFEEKVKEEEEVRPNREFESLKKPNVSFLPGELWYSAPPLGVPQLDIDSRIMVNKKFFISPTQGLYSDLVCVGVFVKHNNS